MTEIRAVGLLGGGVIGAGWATRCLMNGLDVVVADPDPEAARKLDEVLENARRAYDRLGLAPPGGEGRLRLTRSLEEAAASADFIQESLPEREDLKIGLLARAAAAARPEVVIGSSTSGLRPSRLQTGMRHPERLVVGHPFNPVYLMPLVEVCGGQATAPETLVRAAAFYRSLGLRPLMVRKEIDGFIADRLMEALWREALWLVNDGIATTGEIDDAIRFGPGLRWSFMGTFLIYRIAGGEAGMRHFMAQFGPALKWPWSKLTDVPELTEDLLDRIVAQSDDQAAGASIRELERLRDDCLIAVLEGLRGRGYAAGAGLEAQRRAVHSSDLMPEIVVAADWLDGDGRLGEAARERLFAAAADALLRRHGLQPEGGSDGLLWVTVERHGTAPRVVAAGARLGLTTGVVSADAARLRLRHDLHDADGAVAGEERTLMPMRGRCAVSIPDELVARLGG